MRVLLFLKRYCRPVYGMLLYMMLLWRMFRWGADSMGCAYPISLIVKDHAESTVLQRTVVYLLKNCPKDCRLYRIARIFLQTSALCCSNWGLFTMFELDMMPLKVHEDLRRIDYLRLAAEHGYRPAILYIAKRMMSRYPEETLEMLESYQKPDGEIRLQQAICYLNYMKGKNNTVKGLKCLQEAVLLKNAAAQHMLGTMLYRQKNKKEQKIGKALLRKAARRRYVPAILAAAKLDLSRCPRRSIRRLRKAVKLGCGEACAILGEIYDKGQYGVKQDHKKACRYWLAGAECPGQKQGECKLKLGIAAMNGNGIPYSFHRAEELLRDAAHMGENRAFLELARLYLKKNPIRSHYLEEGVECLIQAYILGDTQAALWLAELYHDGSCKALPQSKEKATAILESIQSISLDAQFLLALWAPCDNRESWYHSMVHALHAAAESGSNLADGYMEQHYHSRAIYRLDSLNELESLAQQGDKNAAFSMWRLCIEKFGDSEQGIDWLRKSTVNRCRRAFYEMGNQFLKTGHRENAEICWLLSAEAGDARALEKMLKEGLRLEDSKGMRKSLRKFASMGNPESMVFLGDFYAEKQAWGRSIRWYRKSQMIECIPSACVRLAECCRDGRGCKKDLQKTKEMYEMALVYSPDQDEMLSEKYEYIKICEQGEVSAEEAFLLLDLCEDLAQSSDPEQSLYAQELIRLYYQVIGCQNPPIAQIWEEEALKGSSLCQFRAGCSWLMDRRLPVMAAFWLRMADSNPLAAAWLGIAQYPLQLSDSCTK